mmetsp:Transcript_29304/g.71180  ORF Transcript_29304/g.71180 Transcript_29304/m.71180 type:complete len:222 (+) Transcript_29304:239-904(+)
MDAMRKLNASSRLPHLCVEAHTGIDEKITWVERLRELDELRSSFALSGVPMRMVLLLRLREPLDHYLSFFVWAVAERQARSPAKFGSSFEEWVRRVPNLQSELVLSSKAASTAGFAPRTHPEVRAWVKRWGSLKAYSERRARVWQSVKLYNVLLPTTNAPSLLARGMNISSGPSFACRSLARRSCSTRRTCSSLELFRGTLAMLRRRYTNMRCLKLVQAAT